MAVHERTLPERMMRKRREKSWSASAYCTAKRQPMTNARTNNLPNFKLQSIWIHTTEQNFFSKHQQPIFGIFGVSHDHYCLLL